ncbi:hypothetical protein ACTVZO_44555 [Streptomyces sp. IBSNAI002]|uniref:hypothetical protein n=1 Tax=Streptomyces sp. IBSNAI002 TaxID=3457500 RepID=UPI003FD1D487
MWWNELCLTAGQFSEHPDHLLRWRQLEHMCLECAAWLEQLNDGFSSLRHVPGRCPSVTAPAPLHRTVTACAPASSTRCGRPR